MSTFTFLFTDIEGSTALLRGVGAETYGVVRETHDRLIRERLANHEGKEVDLTGDSFFAVFSSPRACVAAVVDMQRALSSNRWPDGIDLKVRMGVHAGEAVETPAGLVGYDVHRAARVAAVAHGSQVLLSSAAAELVRDTLPPNASLRDLGVHSLKDLSRPERIYQLEADGLPAEFPPLRSLDDPALANNLPAQPSCFIGREKELAELHALRATRRLLTLTGAGGSGKTRLALQLAVSCCDGSGDGVWLVELAGVTNEADVAPAIAAAMRITLPGGSPPADSLLDALEPQDLLLILDNCEHLIGTCAKVADAIVKRCPRVHLLCTSREPLGIAGEAIYRVPSLSLPDEDEGAWLVHSDTVELFIDRALSQGVKIEADETTAPLVASICRRLDGMPLAIELAAARLPSLSLADLSVRLDQRFRLLTGGSRSALPRQQTLRATVDWSYSLLGDAEKAVLRRLSVFAEGFDLEAAEAVVSLQDIDPIDVANLVSSLVDKSLVFAEPAGTSVRYRLLETIRQFAAERMVDASVDEAASAGRAHCQHFLQLAEEASYHFVAPDQGSWFRRVRIDDANFRRAIEHAMHEPGGTHVVLRFVGALRSYWWAYDRGRELFDHLLAVMERPEAEDWPEALVGALITMVMCARVRAVSIATRLSDRALGVARTLVDDGLLIDALWTACAVAHFRGDRELGQGLGEEAVAGSRATGDDLRLGQSLAMFLLGDQLAGSEGADYASLLDEAIECARRAGDRFLVHLLLNNAASGSLSIGEVALARRQLAEAEVILDDLGVQFNTVDINMGWVLREEGDLSGALARFVVALRRSRRAGMGFANGCAILGVACVAGDVGDWRASAVLHGAAGASFDRLGEPFQQPEEHYRKMSKEAGVVQLETAAWEGLFTRGRGLDSEGVFELATRSVTVPS